MKTSSMRVACVRAALLCAVLLLPACASPTLEQRIEHDEDAYQSWPPDTREKVAAGQIDVGFTREQVRMAWGEPTRKDVTTTERGTFENWYWERKSPSFSIGVGVGSFGRHTGVSTGVGTTVGGDTNLVALVRFQKGYVVSFQRDPRAKVE